jgi:hypothetical protein
MGGISGIEKITEKNTSGTREPEQKILYFLFRFPCLSLLVAIEAAYVESPGKTHPPKKRRALKAASRGLPAKLQF